MKTTTKYFRTTLNMTLLAVYIFFAVLVLRPAYKMYHPEKNLKYTDRLTIREYNIYLKDVSEKSNMDCEIYEENMDEYMDLLTNTSYSPTKIVKDKDSGYVFLTNMDEFNHYIDRTYDVRLFQTPSGEEMFGKFIWTEKIFEDLGIDYDFHVESSVKAAEGIVKNYFKNEKVIVGFSYLPEQYKYSLRSVVRDGNNININLDVEPNTEKSQTKTTLEKNITTKVYLIVPTLGKNDKINLNIYKESPFKVVIVVIELCFIIILLIPLMYNLAMLKRKSINVKITVKRVEREERKHKQNFEDEFNRAGDDDDDDPIKNL